MSRAIDYYFSVSSPWTWLGHVAFMEIAARHDLAVAFKPAQLRDVFAETGGAPLVKRPPARQRYRFVDLQRWRLKRGAKLNLRPKFSPFDASLADRCVIAAVDAGRDPDPFIRRVCSAVWERDLDMADEQALGRALREGELDPMRTLQAAKSERSVQTYDRFGKEAVAADVFGAPSYVLDGEVFWGQDRLDLLDDALQSGRAPFQPMA